MRCIFRSTVERVALSVLLGALLSSCMGNGVNPEEAKFLLPLQTEQGPRFSEVRLPGLKSISTLKTEGFEFFSKTRIENNRLAGEPLQLHLSRGKKGNTFFPTDTQTSEALVMYYYLQKLKTDFESISGRKLRTIQVGLRVFSQQVDTGYKLDNRAYFHRPTGALIFTPYDRSELALTLNPGVVAHEFFHIIFAEVFGPELEAQIQAAELRNLLIWNGLNEGLADFWGWSFSKDPRFVARSLKEEEHRSLLQSPSRLPSRLQLDLWSAERRSAPSGYIDTIVYNYFAPRYARFLKAVVDIYGGEQVHEQPHQEMRQIVYQSLLSLKTTLSVGGIADFSANSILAELASQLPEMSAPLCSVFVKMRADEPLDETHPEFLPTECF